MKISGSGLIGSGEYENITISGSGKIQGAIKCENLSVAGSASGESIECNGEMKIAGNCSFSSNIKTNEIRVSGSFKCGGSIASENSFKCSGYSKIEKSIKCKNFNLSGYALVNDGIEAEDININGKIDCEGLINAENITIKFWDSTSKIGSIGGSKLTVKKESGKDLCSRLPILKWFYKTTHKVKITNEIECDIIDIDNVTAPKVTGRIVKIGENCEVDLVQYSETVEISPKAKVGKTEKI